MNLNSAADSINHLGLQPNWLQRHYCVTQTCQSCSCLLINPPIVHSENWHCCHLRPKCSYGPLGTQSWRKISGLATWKIMSGCGKYQWLFCCPLDPGGHRRIRWLTVTYQKCERQESWLAGIREFNHSWGFYLEQNKDGANSWYYKGRSGGCRRG